MTAGHLARNVEESRSFTMSRTQMISVHARYSPVGDAVRRHEGGVTKAKKAALTGSGRAWREDEVRAKHARCHRKSD